MIGKLKFHLTCTVIVALAWVVLFRLNNLIFSAIQLKNMINWIFLPSGLRLLATLLLQRHAITGLFIGALITGNDLNNSTTDQICISIISASTPYIAYLFVKQNFDLNDSLDGITTKQLIVISAIFAAFNSISHNLYFLVNIYYEFWVDTLGMFTGDFFGSALILCMFLFTIKLARRYTAKTVISKDKKNQ